MTRTGAIYCFPLVFGYIGGLKASIFHDGDVSHFLAAKQVAWRGRRLLRSRRQLHLRLELSYRVSHFLMGSVLFDTERQFIPY